MIDLTKKQCREVAQSGNRPVRVRDPRTLAEYVVVPAELFEKMRRIVEAEIIDPSFYEFEETAS